MLKSLCVFALIAAALAAGTDEGCQITASTCVNDAQFSGTFRDSYGEQHLNTGTNSAACLARAKEYFEYCGNSGQSQSVKAKFLSTGAESTFPSASACMITFGFCKGDTSLNGKSIQDTWGELHKNAGADEAACHARAKDYYAHCGNTGSGHEAVTAVFSGTSKSAQYPSQEFCQITIKKCSSHPSYDFLVFTDFYGQQVLNADTDEVACLGRARDYFTWCDNVKDQYNHDVTAHYLPTGKQTVFDGTLPGCKITLHVCPNHPDLSGKTFDDVWGHENLNTHQDQEACLSRTQTYHSWCGSSASQPAYAMYSPTGQSRYFPAQARRFFRR